MRYGKEGEGKKGERNGGRMEVCYGKGKGKGKGKRKGKGRHRGRGDGAGKEM